MAGKKAEKVEPLVVRTKVRELAKDMRFSDEFFKELDKKVAELVKAAVERAKANGRATLRPYDL
jgi:histone H3/H4